MHIVIVEWISKFKDNLNIAIYQLDDCFKCTHPVHFQLQDGYKFYYMVIEIFFISGIFLYFQGEVPTFLISG